MTDAPKAFDDPSEPLNAKVVDGVVVIKNPPEAEVNLTADAAEISGLRLMDAADQARADSSIPRRRR